MHNRDAIHPQPQDKFIDRVQFELNSTILRIEVP